LTWLSEIPIIIKVLGSLAVIIIMSRWFRELHVPVLVGVLVLALSNGHGPGNIFWISWERSVSTNNLFLMLIIFQVIWLSSQMGASGVMKELVSTVRQRISQRASMAVLPAVIGFLPMPGGALFSAPLVDDCDTDQTLDPLLKTRVNYWFRHIWEYWWPLYPGVLLAIEISGVETWRFMLIQLPLSLCSVLVGSFFLLRKIPRVPVETNEISEKQGSHFFVLLLPILVVVAVYAVIKVLLPQVSDLNKYLPMAVGILVAQVVLQIQRPLPGGEWRKIFLAKRVFMLVLLVLLIRIYGAFIEANLPTGVSLVEQLRSEFVSYHIPPILVLMLIPFICAVSTGIAVGFIGASFPIVMSVIGVDPEPAVLYPSLALAFGFGYMGMLLSPVHVCLIVTNQHFKTSLYRSIKALILPAITMLLLISGYFLLLKSLL